MAEASEPLTALARPISDGSSVADFGADVHVRLKLSQPVLWRVYALPEPMRIVLEFGSVDFSGVDMSALLDSDAVERLEASSGDPGWTRLTLWLAEPLTVETAGMGTGAEDGSAMLKLQLTPGEADDFAEQVEAFPVPASVTSAAPPPEDGPPIVVLDPGHGGIDPGAQAELLNEADLMLTFARELAVILEDRGMTAVLTRDSDIFVPLETRVSIARAAGAHLFLSLHADALEEGGASGASVYTLSAEAEDEATQRLTERHARDDLVQGIDLSKHDDEVAEVLMSLARTDTRHRSDRLADAIVDGLSAATGHLHKRPRLSAGFSVLKAPDIPSVLVELGFLSSARDRQRLSDRVWRNFAAEGIAEAIEAWLVEDAEVRRLARQ